MGGVVLCGVCVVGGGAGGGGGGVGVGWGDCDGYERGV